MLNAQISGTLEDYKEKEEVQANERKEAEAKANPLSSEDPKTVAYGLLMQVELLEAEAEKKRAEAYEMCPALIPSKKKRRPRGEPPKVDADGNKLRGRPKLTEEERRISNENKKEKRRTRDRANTAKKRGLREKEALTKAVNEKIILDSQRTT